MDLNTCKGVYIKMYVYVYFKHVWKSISKVDKFVLEFSERKRY